MYSASRLSSCVEVWDVRYAADPLGKYPRPGKTNQRMDFDVDPTGSWIAIGDQVSPSSVVRNESDQCQSQDGLVEIYSAEYDASAPQLVTSFQAAQGRFAFASARTKLISRFSVADSIGSTLFHPSQSMLMTCSGTRRFDAEEGDSSDEEEAIKIVDEEDSLKFWSL